MTSRFVNDIIWLPNDPFFRCDVERHVYESVRIAHSVGDMCYIVVDTAGDLSAYSAL